MALDPHSVVVADGSGGEASDVEEGEHIPSAVERGHCGGVDESLREEGDPTVLFPRTDEEVDRTQRSLSGLQMVEAVRSVHDLRPGSQNLNLARVVSWLPQKIQDFLGKI